MRISSVVFVTTCLWVGGCAGIDRLSAVPAAETKIAAVYGIPNARYVLDDTARTELVAEFQRSYEREVAHARMRRLPLPSAVYLALSGGGDNGAFGAGLLVGWTDRRTRPSFKAVTGISTGALSAPFAFLGSQYDPSLASVYTDTDLADVAVKRPIIAGLTSDALADSGPLLKMITHHLTDEMVASIGREYNSGRLLFIGTTNLDAARPVIWNIGAIAASGNPRGPELIRRVLLASASIPGIFPPVMLEVEMNGATFQEMHGDGGAVAQTFLYPPTVSLARMSARAPARRRTAYIIRNGKLFEDWKQVDRTTLSVAGRAVSTLIASNGVGDLYRIHAVTRRDGVGFNYALIEPDFTEPYKGPFDRGYMNALFAYGRAKGRSGKMWRSAPPGMR